MRVLIGISCCLLVAACATGPEPKPLVDRTPRYVVYYNSDATPLVDVGRAAYSHVIVSFVRVIADRRGRLEILPPKHMKRQWRSVRRVQAAGKQVLVSFGGGLADTAEYTALIDREAEVADLLARWIRKRHLDGIDIDFEASAMFHQRRDPGVGDGRKFLIDLTRELRLQLPAPRYVISHAPEPPYLNPEWHGGPYLDILAAVGDSVDWITVQYYNNGPYDDPVPLAAPSNLGDTSYTGLTAPGGYLRWPPGKVVIGKPIYESDASSGHLAPEAVVDSIILPLLATHGSGFGGIAGWQFSDLTDDHRAWNESVGSALIRARETH